MEEKRKHAILFAAMLLCARKLIESIEADKPNLAKQRARAPLLRRSAQLP
jgi:hypothetical protein